MATPGRAGRMQPVQVDGLTEVRATLELLPDEFRAAAARSIAEGSQVIEQEAKERVQKRSRDLMRSIKANMREDGLQVAVGTPLPYGRWLELGTSRQGPQPWLYPAFKRGARHVRKEMRHWAQEAGERVRFKTKRRKPRATG